MYFGQSKFVVKIASDFAPASWRKNSPSRRRRESEFIGENGRNSVGVPTARPLLGWFSTAKFHSGARGGSRTHMNFRSKDFKSFVYTIPPLGQAYLIFSNWRPRRELNPRIRDLQSLALPLCYSATITKHPCR